MRVIVCGGRDYNDTAKTRTVLLALYGADTLVHGDARGADRTAAAIGESLGFNVERWPADWNAHGKAAGPIRNQQMLDAGADLVVAFPGGQGTADMVRRARAAGVTVLKVDG